MGALPAPDAVGSMMALNGPFRGRLVTHNSLSLSARDTVVVARDTVIA